MGYKGTGRTRVPQRDPAREQAASVEGNVKTWHMSPEETEDYFARIADKRPRDVEGKRVSPPVQQNERRMEDMGKQKQGPNPHAFLKLIASGMSVAKAEQELGLKQNGMYYWLKKWDLIGIDPGKARRLLEPQPVEESVMRSSSKEAQKVEEKATELKASKPDPEKAIKGLNEQIAERDVAYGRLLLENKRINETLEEHRKTHAEVVEDRQEWKQVAQGSQAELDALQEKYDALVIQEENRNLELQEAKQALEGAAVIANHSGARIGELEQAIAELEEEREMLLATIEKASEMEPQLVDTSGTDNVHSPAHYTQGGIETIDFIRAKLTPEEFRGYCKGNALKYVSRAELKNGDEDLRKAGVYLGWAVEA